VSKEAKKHLSVILSGDGADELFAGYRRYVATKHLSKFKNISFLLKILPLSHNKQSILGYLNRLSIMLSKKDLDYYLSATTDVFNDIIPLDETVWTNKMNSVIKKINNSNFSNLSKMLYMDFTFILFNDLLKKMDIASMANSLEVRSPFLSSSLIDITPRIKDEYKINGVKTKFLLRELAKKYLPNELINAPKRGFEVPLTSWVDNELKDNILDSFKNGYHLNYLDKSDIDKIINNKITISKNKRAKILWSIFSLNIWHKNCVVK
jgi:asparagine synthase (glutamine-hydrolysing)